MRQLHKEALHNFFSV